MKYSLTKACCEVLADLLALSEDKWNELMLKESPASQELEALIVLVGEDGCQSTQSCVHA